MANKYVRPKYQQTWQSKGGYLDKDIAVKIVPSPTGGWDAISPLSAMEPQYAASMVNWTPRTSWVDLRGGAVNWCKISNAAVNTLMTYRPSASSGAQRFFAVSGAQLWEVTDVSQPALLVTGLSSDKYQYVNFTPNLGSSYILAVNGADSGIRSFNGTAWAVQSITGAGGAIFANIAIFKRRVWLVPPSSTICYFLGTDAITGAATAQDLGPFLSKGGYIMAIGTWTLDGGNGPDDYIVFYSSEGQAAIYKGTDPTNANAWQLIGVFDFPKPIGRRCMMRLGSDLLLITEQGIIPISQALPFDPSASRSVAITNRVQNAFSLAALEYKSNFGWQLCSFPQQNLILCNIPQTAGGNQVQYVQNAITGAWTQYNGWNGNCFETFEDSLYYGGNDGWVNIAFVGGVDLNEPILCDVKCAFNYLDEPGRLKNAGMLRPFLVADGTVNPTIQIDVDFEDSSPSAEVTTLDPFGGVWDEGIWDESIWSQGTVTITNWLSVNALGTALAIRMVVNLDGNPIDPPYPPNTEDVKILLNFNGVDGGTTIVDTNGAGISKTWAVSGNAQLDTAEFELGNASLLLDGTGDAISTTDNANYALGNSDFTVDLWFNCTATTGSRENLCGQLDNAITPSLSSFGILRNTSDKIEAGVSNGSTFVVLTSVDSFTNLLNPGWHHCALVRYGNIVTLYIDGVAVDSDSFTGTVPDSGQDFGVGNCGGLGTDPWTGWIDEFRFTNGVAWWTDDFTPPTGTAAGLVSGAGVPTLRINLFEITVEYGGPI